MTIRPLTPQALHNDLMALNLRYENWYEYRRSSPANSYLFKVNNRFTRIYVQI